MENFLRLPHRVCKSTCFSNGIEDVLEWKGYKYMNYFIPILGGMGEFAYLKFKNAKPPQMVFWGANTKYLMNDLEKIIGFKQVISENKTFKNTFTALKGFIADSQPIVAGALDMYYLNYYPEIYHKKHIPIHYVLIVGYNDDKQEVYVQDCGQEKVQKISYSEFEKSLNINVPGMSKKNTIRTFVLPSKFLSELAIAQKGLNFRAEKMLNPPIKLFGIPAMRKLAKEIFVWKDKESFEHLAIYATTPPELPKTFEKSDGMRFWKSQVLKKLGEKYNIAKWSKASAMFQKSGELIVEISKAAMKQDKHKISSLILQVAEIEETAYGLLKSV